MELSDVTYQGPEFLEDDELVRILPENLLGLLKQINGFIQFGGGLHVRGVCANPKWHSLKAAMSGELALYKLFPNIDKTDIPFAQDCVADQYVLRDRIVHKLFSETGEIENLKIGLHSFFNEVSKETIEFLGMEPLLSFQSQQRTLEPGQVIHVYPPFCIKEAQNGVSLKAISYEEAILYLSGFSKTISKVGDGGKIGVKITK